MVRCRLCARPAALRDSVRPYNQYTGEGTGFSFANYNAHELMATIDSALDVWKNHPDDWRTMQKSAMAEDFSWRASAKKYRALYRDLLKTE